MSVTLCQLGTDPKGTVTQELGEISLGSADPSVHLGSGSFCGAGNGDFTAVCPRFSVFLTCWFSQPGFTFPTHCQMSLPLKFHQNFYYQGFGTSFLPDSRGRNAPSFNPTLDKLWHILWLWLHPPQHPDCGITAAFSSSSPLVQPGLRALRAPHSLIFFPKSGRFVMLH